MGTDLLPLEGGQARGASSLPSVSRHFDPKIWRTLTRDVGDSEWGVRIVLEDPAAYEAARARIDDLIAAVKPAGPAGVVRALQEVAVIYGVPWENDKIRGVALSVYQEALGDLSAEALAFGVKAYHREADAVFFPKPGQLRKLALPHFAALCRAAHRARAAVAHQPRAVAPPTLEQRLAGKQLLADTLQALSSPRAGGPGRCVGDRRMLPGSGAAPRAGQLVSPAVARATPSVARPLADDAADLL